MPNHYAVRIQVPDIGEFRVQFESKVPWEYRKDKEGGLCSAQIYHAARFPLWGSHVRVFITNYSHSYNEYGRLKTTIDYTEMQNPHFFRSMGQKCERNIAALNLSPISPDGLVRDRYCYLKIIPELCKHVGDHRLVFGAPEEDE